MRQNLDFNQNQEYKNYRKSFFGRFYQFLVISNFIIAILILMGFFDYVYDSEEKYFTFIIHISIVPLLLLIPRFFYFQNNIKSRFNINFLKAIEICAAYVFVANELGSLYFFKRFEGYDSFAHISVFIIFSIFIMLLYFSIKNFNSINKKEIILFTIFFIFLGFLFEGFEKFSDIFFNTKMFYDPFQAIRADTISDLFFNFFGILLGVLIFFLGFDEMREYLKKRD